MKKLGKINLRTIERDLSENEMKFVTGGYGSGGDKPCKDKKENQCCSVDGSEGACRYFPFSSGLVCHVGFPCQ